MLLLAFTPDVTGLVTEAPAKSTGLHRFYDFIVQSQTRRAEHEVARYLQRAPKAGVSHS
jgi:hypothetical protein